MANNQNRNRSSKPQQIRAQRRMDGPVLYIEHINGNESIPLPRDIKPSDALDFLWSQPQFERLRNILQDLETYAELQLIRNGYIERRVPIQLQGFQPRQQQPPQQQHMRNGQVLPDGDQVMENLASEMNQQANPSLDNVEDEIPDGQLTAMEFLRDRIAELREEIYYLESLQPLVEQLAVESPQELAFRAILKK